MTLGVSSDPSLARNERGAAADAAAKRVLIIEDNQRLASLLSRALREDGYMVDVVEDGGLARDRLNVESYGLVILDWMLPTLDGLSVCRATRAAGIDVPILMLTARSDASERILGLDTGADDFLAKPFNLGELMARVRALLRRRAGGHALVFGPIRINRAERTASLDGNALDLTRDRLGRRLSLEGRGKPLSRRRDCEE